MEDSPNTNQASDESAPERGKTIIFSNTREALLAFDEQHEAMRAFLKSLESTKEELFRERQSLKEKERRLSTELARFSQTNEQFEKQSLFVGEIQRNLKAQEELLRTTQDELATKSQALTRVKTEYRDVLERFNNCAVELENLKAKFADVERKREHLEQTNESSLQELKERKNELAELNIRVLDQTVSVNELQAKLFETESAMKQANEQLLVQGQELKEARWELLQQREELRVTRGELNRKGTLLESAESELEKRANSARTQQDTIAQLESDVTRTSKRLSEHQESLAKANARIAEQAATTAALDKELALTHELLEDGKLELRQSKKELHYERNSRETLSQELSRLQQIHKKKLILLQRSDEQLEALRKNLDAEVSRRKNAEELLEQQSSELTLSKENVAALHHSLVAAEEHAREMHAQLEQSQEDYERLQLEHRSLLRAEAEGARELDTTREELRKKTALLRAAQTDSASLREKMELLGLKFDQQSVALMESQRKASKLQDELDIYRRQFSQSKKVPELESEIEELKQEIEGRNLRLKQQDQLIRILQSRITDKTVVQLNGREAPPRIQGAKS